ncbi:uncharacterized protein HfgLR_21255 (plasmid) [Haloferax gibbonsii]|uniref:Uncharacterized protein n=1 Tax=Haloferax gibbonsii TaxID=35746 RepID=A0A871BLC1_HALGI|nr:uncharacterized protein HfgLR_21255 [Haloferax gibbonsii]
MGTTSTDREYDGTVDSSSVGGYLTTKRTLDLPTAGFGSHLNQSKEMTASQTDQEGPVGD